MKLKNGKRTVCRFPLENEKRMNELESVYIFRPFNFQLDFLIENWYLSLPWQISTFCFAYKCKHNANTNYDTNTNQKSGRVFYKSNVYFM